MRSKINILGPVPLTLGLLVLLYLFGNRVEIEHPISGLEGHATLHRSEALNESASPAPWLTTVNVPADAAAVLPTIPPVATPTASPSVLGVKPPVLLPWNLKTDKVPSIPLAGSSADAIRRAIAVRAAQWYDVAPYVFGGKKAHDPGKGYRLDCSGFVAYAWGLPHPDPVTSRFRELGYAVGINLDQLELGDTLNNEGIGPDGHMILFWEWADPARTKFWAMEMAGRFTDFDGDVLIQNSNAVLSQWEIYNINQSAAAAQIRRLVNQNTQDLVSFTDGEFYVAERYVGLAGR